MPLGLADLQHARAAAEHHLSESLDREGCAAIYTSSGRTTPEFTDDPERLRQALERVRPYKSAGYSPTDCPHVDYWNEDKVHARAERGRGLAGVDFWWIGNGSRRLRNRKPREGD